MRRVAVQEINDVHGLHKMYRHPERKDEAVLRVFHVQNADWATRFLLDKFNIEDKHDLVGRDFGKFVRRKQPERRGKKPFLTGKTWKVQHDPWRGLSKTCFGFDYLKHYPAHTVPDKPGDEDVSQKMIELSCFNEDGRVCTHVFPPRRASLLHTPRALFPVVGSSARCGG